MSFSQSTRYPWTGAPFIRLVPPFVTGILWMDMNGPFNPNIVWLVLFVNLVTLVLLNTVFGPLQYFARWLTGIPVNLVVFSIGHLVFSCHQVREDKRWAGHYFYDAIAITGTPVSLPEPGKKSARFGFDCESVITRSGKEIRVTGLVNVYVPPDLQKNFLPGDVWLIRTSSLKELIPSDNPGSFDFARYCSRNQIFHQAFVTTRDCHFVSKAHAFNLRKLFATGRISAMNALRNAMPEDTRALAMALLIGYRQEMDKELTKAYTDTGVIHVIAVSGMHLGLIFLILQSILKLPESRFRLPGWFTALLLVTITWWFSGVAGSAASIVRAAGMFTLGLAGRLTRRNCSGIHGLFLFAFLLLCYRPSWLWDAGFLLSFLALLGILVFQPVFERIVTIRNRLLNAAWQLCSVTFAAQLLTFPVSIYLFHQSPVYFLPANLWAVPLSNFALIITLLQWLISALGLPWTWAGSMAHLLIRAMNAGIGHISGLPMAVVTGLNWQLPETLLLYPLMACLATWCVYRYMKAFIASLVLVVLLLGIYACSVSEKRQQRKLIVYHLPGKSVTDLINGQNALRHGNVHGHMVLREAERFFATRSVSYSGSPLFRSGKVLIVIPRNNQEILPLLSLRPQILVITGRITDLPRLDGLPLEGTYYVFDGSVREKKAAAWEQLFHKAGVEVHITWKAGSFQKDLNKLAGLR